MGNSILKVVPLLLVTSAINVPVSNITEFMYVTITELFV